MPSGATASPEAGAQPSETDLNPWSPSRLVAIARRRLWLIATATCITSLSMIFQTLSQVPEYQGSFRLLIEPVQEEEDLARLTDGQTNSPKEFDYSTQIEVLYSPKLLNPILDQVAQKYPSTNYGDAASHLSVQRLGETKIVEVSYTDTDPDQAYLVLQKLAEGYLKYSLEEQQVRRRQGLEFIRQQLPTLRQRVSLLQLQIQRLRQQYPFVDPETYAQELSSQLTSLSQQRQTLKTELAALQVRQANLQAQATAAANLAASKTYEDLVQEAQVLEKQIAIEAARLSPDHPKLKRLRQEQENLLPLIQAATQQNHTQQLAAVAQEIRVLKARDRTLANTEQNLQAQYRQMPAVTRHYAELQRELKMATGSLDRFLETQEALAVQVAQNEVPWQLLAPPEQPTRKPGTSLTKSLALGLGAGLTIGLVLSLLWEKWQNTYYSQADLKAKVGLPLLGVIPYHQDLATGEVEVNLVTAGANSLGPAIALSEDTVNLRMRLKTLLLHHHQTPFQRNKIDLNSNNLPVTLPREQTDSGSQNAKPEDVEHPWLTQPDSYTFLEAVRTLQANLEHLQTTQKLRSVVISSALPHEGRTTIAIHLAQAAAAMGRRVLLVDAHLRPGGRQVHSLLNLPDHLGLSSYLTHQASLTQTLQRLSGELSLFILPCGPYPHDPTRLLGSETMQALIKRSHQLFDLVIYDMPPLMGLADVNLIAAKADGILLISALGQQGSVTALSQTLERLKISQLPVLGIVVNKTKDYAVDFYI